MIHPNQNGLHPSFCYTIFAANSSREFRCTFDYADHPNFVEVAGEWSPEDPMVHTSHASLEISWPGQSEIATLSLSGCDHRQLEDEGKFDDLLLRIASGCEPQQALSALTA
ncbi:MAG: hypothetical protein ACRER5_22865 [Pseudomonas sp.]